MNSIESVELISGPYDWFSSSCGFSIHVLARLGTKVQAGKDSMRETFTGICSQTCTKAKRQVVVGRCPSGSLFVHLDRAYFNTNPTECRAGVRLSCTPSPLTRGSGLEIVRSIIRCTLPNVLTRGCISYTSLCLLLHPSIRYKFRSFCPPKVVVQTNVKPSLIATILFHLPHTSTVDSGKLKRGMQCVPRLLRVAHK